MQQVGYGGIGMLVFLIRGGSRMISKAVRFYQITVLTRRIRKDRPEQKSVDPDRTPQNAASDQGLLCLSLAQQ